MAGLPDNRSLLSFLSLLNGGNKDSLGDSTYLDSFKPTEYFANLQGGTAAMQGIYNLGNTVANLANRENNEKTRRIQQNIMQNTAMFTNAFQQEIRNLDKDYAADIDASVAELYATTDPAKQEVIRKDIIGKQAAYRKAISDKVNLFRGYATQGSPWLLPNKVESVLSGAPSVIEASLGVPQPSVKSIGDTQGNGTTKDKWSDEDAQNVLEAFHFKPFVQQSITNAVYGPEAEDGVLDGFGINLKNPNISAMSAKQLKDFYDSDHPENRGKNNPYYLRLVNNVINSLIKKGGDLHDEYVKLVSMGYGDKAYTLMQDYATQHLDRLMQGRNATIETGKMAYDAIHESTVKEHNEKIEATRQKARNISNAGVKKIIARFGDLNNDPEIFNFLRQGLDTYANYLNDPKESNAIGRGSQAMITLGNSINREGMEDITDDTYAISSNIDNALRLIDPKTWTTEGIKTALNKDSSSNMKLFFDLQLLGNVANKLKNLSPQEKWVALGKLGEAMQQARESNKINDPGIMSAILNEVGLSNEIVDPRLNKAIFMAAQRVGVYDPRVLNIFSRERKQLDELQKNSEDIINMETARKWRENYLLNRSRVSATTGQKVDDAPLDDTETQNILSAAHTFGNRGEAVHNKFINAGSTPEKVNKRKTLVKLANALHSLTVNGDIQISNLEGLKSKIDELMNDTNDLLDEDDLNTYKELKKLLNNPKKARIFFNNLKEMDKATR